MDPVIAHGDLRIGSLRSSGRGVHERDWAPERHRAPSAGKAREGRHRKVAGTVPGRREYVALYWGRGRMEVETGWSACERTEARRIGWHSSRGMDVVDSGEDLDLVPGDAARAWAED